NKSKPLLLFKHYTAALLGTFSAHKKPHYNAPAPSQKALCKVPPAFSHSLVSQGPSSWVMPYNATKAADKRGPWWGCKARAIRNVSNTVPTKVAPTSKLHNTTPQPLGSTSTANTPMACSAYFKRKAGASPINTPALFHNQGEGKVANATSIQLPL